MSFCSRLGRPGPSPRSASSAGRSDRSPSSIARRASCRHVRPTSLPDGRHFVYLSNRKDQLFATLASVDGTGAAALGPVQSHVEATPSGHVVFVRDGTLLAQRLDVAGRTPDRRCHGAGGRPHPAGEVLRWQVLDIACIARLLEGDRAAQLDRAQDLRPFGEDDRGPLASQPSIRIRASRPMARAWPWRATNRASRPAISGCSTLRMVPGLQVTLDAGDDFAPKWSADGQWLMFSSDRRGVRDIYKRLASGEGADELVFESPTSKSVNAWSPDGRFVVYDTGWPDDSGRSVRPSAHGRSPSHRAGCSTRLSAYG